MGFGFDKIHIEKKTDVPKGQEIKNRVNITSLKESKLILGSEEKTSLVIFFEYTVDYKNSGNLALAGHIFYFETSEKIKEIVTQWETKKTAPQDFARTIYGYIFAKTNLKALQLEEEVGLPQHIKIQPPTIKPSKK
jgi:hypothetical protein